MGDVLARQHSRVSDEGPAVASLPDEVRGGDGAGEKIDARGGDPILGRNGKWRRAL